MRKHIPAGGFASLPTHALGGERLNVVFAELLATIGLALSTLVAVTVVSIGVARADVAANVIDNESSLFAVALLLGLLFIGMGGLTALSARHPSHKKRHS